MTNLLTETRKAITDSGHAPSDIVFIGSQESGHACSWVEFEKLANVEYDSGFGGQEVAHDLIVVFRDGTKLWRGEYDGSEWWNFSSPFTMPKELKPIRRLIVHGAGWETLAEIDKEIAASEPSV